MPADLEAVLAAFVRLLHLPPLPQGPGQRDTIRRPQGKAGRDPTAQERKEVQLQTIHRRRRYNKAVQSKVFLVCEIDLYCDGASDRVVK